MEVLVILLAEFLTTVLIPVFVFFVQLAFLLITLLVDLLSWLLRRPTSGAAAGMPPPRVIPSWRRMPYVPNASTFNIRYQRASKLPRLFRVVVVAAFAVLIASLALVNLLFIDPVGRWVLARAGARIGTELTAQRISGDFFTGTFVFENLRATRQSDNRTSFDLNARRLSGDLDLWSLISRPIAFEFVSVEGVSGWLRKPEKRRTVLGQDGEEERLKLRRNFVARELTVRDAGIMLSSGGNAPVAVSLKTLRSAPFRGNYALYDGLFRSNLVGQIDGRDITITTEDRPFGRTTRWRIPELAAASLSRFVTVPPVGWLREGTLDVSLEDHRQDFAKAEIVMDWTVRMQGVRAQAREGAGFAERAAVLPFSRYINSRDGNAELSFRLMTSERAFENMASLDAAFLWQGLLKGCDVGWRRLFTRWRQPGYARACAWK